MCINCDWREMEQAGKELHFKENIQGYKIVYHIPTDRWFLTDVCGTEYVRIRINNCPWCGKRFKAKAAPGDLQYAPKINLTKGNNEGLHRI